jgi:hypothetical protein
MESDGRWSEREADERLGRWQKTLASYGRAKVARRPRGAARLSPVVARWVCVPRGCAPETAVGCSPAGPCASFATCDWRALLGLERGRPPEPPRRTDEANVPVRRRASCLEARARAPRTQPLGLSHFRAAWLLSPVFWWQISRTLRCTRSHVTALYTGLMLDVRFFRTSASGVIARVSTVRRSTDGDCRPDCLFGYVSGIVVHARCVEFWCTLRCCV